MYDRTRIMIRDRQLEWMLTGLWILGLLGGAACASTFAQGWIPMLSDAAGCSVRWSGALGVTIFPLIGSLAAALLLGRKVVWILCPLRSFLLGMTAGAIGLCWGKQAPVMAGMLLFSGLLSSSVLLLLWHSLLCADSRQLRTQTAFLALMQLLIAAADTWIVSPFLVEVINF